MTPATPAEGPSALGQFTVTHALEEPGAVSDRLAAPRSQRLLLHRPAAVDSRGLRAVLSTGARPGLARTLDMATVIAAAIGAVALLSVLCR